MADPKFKYVKWRNGRPRSAHGPRQRARGFVDEDLKHPNGTWLTMEQAGAWSDARVEAVLASRVEGKRAEQAAPRKRLTVAHLLEDWSTSPEFGRLAPTARKSYLRGIRAILFRPMTRAAAAKLRAEIRASKLLGVAPPEPPPEDIASATPSSLGKPELRDFFNYLMTARGHHMALAVISTLSAAMTWGCESALWRLKTNPRPGMIFDRPDGRVVLVPMQAFMAWVNAADAIERPSIGDSLYLALFTGQRQTDRLGMKNESEVPGRHAFRQSKTDELVDIKEAPQLTARLGASHARVAAIKLRLKLRDMPAEIIINESNGQPYDESTYRHWASTSRAVALFGWLDRDDARAAVVRAEACAAELRAAAPKLFELFPIDTPDQEKAERARMIDGRQRAMQEWLASRAARDSNGDAGVWRLPPCPLLMFVNKRGDLDAMHDQDMRDTCVMLLDRAGCDLLTICDITGHSYKSAQTIVKHYRARNAQRADIGIDHLVLQVRKEGMTG